MHKRILLEKDFVYHNLLMYWEQMRVLFMPNKYSTLSFSLEASVSRHLMQATDNPGSNHKHEDGFRAGVAPPLHTHTHTHTHTHSPWLEADRPHGLSARLNSPLIWINAAVLSSCPNEWTRHKIQTFLPFAATRAHPPVNQPPPSQIFQLVLSFKGIIFYRAGKR